MDRPETAVDDGEKIRQAKGPIISRVLQLL